MTLKVPILLKKGYFKLILCVELKSLNSQNWLKIEVLRFAYAFSVAKLFIYT